MLLDKKAIFLKFFHLSFFCLFYVCGPLPKRPLKQRSPNSLCWYVCQPYLRVSENNGVFKLVQKNSNFVLGTDKWFSARLKNHV